MKIKYKYKQKKQKFVIYVFKLRACHNGRLAQRLMSVFQKPLVPGSSPLEGTILFTLLTAEGLSYLANL